MVKNKLIPACDAKVCSYKNELHITAKAATDISILKEPLLIKDAQNIPAKLNTLKIPQNAQL
ncbi:MAG: hypothetical protein IPP06_02860 [Saprospiraceae bacterium]|nr:hypothetical protein [Candidatus Vicinibacter affinis]